MFVRRDTTLVPLEERRKPRGSRKQSGNREKRQRPPNDGNGLFVADAEYRAFVHAVCNWAGEPIPKPGAPSEGQLRLRIYYSDGPSRTPKSKAKTKITGAPLALRVSILPQDNGHSLQFRLLPERTGQLLDNLIRVHWHPIGSLF